jgi:hypothetical protein
MPCRKISVTEYKCAKCKHRWVNWANGKEGPKPKRCAKCKRWDWDEGYLSRIEKQLRRDLLKIEENKIEHPTVEGTGFYSIPTDICATFLSIYPRPTVMELRIVLNPICYLGPYDHGRRLSFHKGVCIDQLHCRPGWIPKPDEPGYYHYDFDEKIYEEMVRKEKDIRHQLMQDIIDSRQGILNTNSKHYEYFEDKKRMAKDLIESDPREMLAMMGKEESG